MAKKEDYRGNPHRRQRCEAYSIGQCECRNGVLEAISVNQLTEDVPLLEATLVIKEAELSAPNQGSSGRSERIRTSDPLLPKQVRYQAALRSDRRTGR